MKAIFLIFIGGGVGSVLRYIASSLLRNSYSPGYFPWGTFVVNIVGCFLIGCFSSLVLKNTINAEMKQLLIIGLCGGFTTFSTFSNESLVLLKDGNYLLSFSYIIGSVVLGLIAVILGVTLVNQINS